MLGLAPDPVHGPKDAVLSGQGLFQLVFSRKVSKRYPDEYGQQTLTGKEEHGQAGQDEDRPDAIFGRREQKIHFGVG